MKWFSLSSLRVRLTLIVLVAMIPALALLLYIAEQQRRSASVEGQQDALRLARLVAANQRKLVGGVHQLLTVLAQVPSFDAVSRPHAARF
jgi:sensor histidine kinase regulating citrate/malate metabolism